MSSEFLPFARPRPGTTPPYLYPEYQSTQRRAPNRAPICFEHTLSEMTGPDFADNWAGPDNTDLTRQHRGEPLGERIIVTGHVLDEDGRPVPGTLIELWQCNAAGRYHHPVDQHDAPLDPNFTGAGQVVTGAGRRLSLRHDQARRLSLAQHAECVAPGAYPFRRVRPRLRDTAHHADVFPGRSAAAIRPDLSEHGRCGGARAADLRLRSRRSASRNGRSATASTWCCAAAPRPRWIRLTWTMAEKLIPTPSQTVGPFFHLGMDRPEWADLTAGNPRGERIVIAGRVLDGDGAPVPDAVLEVWQANEAGRYNHPDDRRDDAAARSGFPRLRPGRDRRRRRLSADHGQARSGAGARQRAAGATHQRRGVRARPAAAPLYADLFRRRSAQCRRPLAVVDRGCRGARYAAGPPQPKLSRQSGASTSCCRARTRRRFSISNSSDAARRFPPLA